MFGKPKHARMGSFGNVPCLTFIPHTISLRKRENHLIIPLNSHENHPGSERNHSPCSHWERELNLVQFWECPASFSKLSWPLVLVWFYTNTDFLLCRAGNADLCFPEGPVAPVRKSRNSLAILSHILWTCCRWGEASAALKGFPTALAAGQVFPWYLKDAEACWECIIKKSNTLSRLKCNVTEFIPNYSSYFQVSEYVVTSRAVFKEGCNIIS